MFIKIQQYEPPPKPVIREDTFSKGITTRLMVKRNLDESRKTNLSFSSGASIPNSIIRNPKHNSKTRNQGSASTLNSTMSLNGLKVLKEENHDKMVSRTAMVEESPLQKMRESVRKRSLNSSTKLLDDPSNKSSGHDSQKLIRRVSMRTDMLPEIGSRRPTQESLREAIQNSEQQVELIDVDELSNSERKNSQANRRNSPVRVSFQA